ncbi:MAG TPA: sulfurtransferase TusA family protein [Bacillota bacterium]
MAIKADYVLDAKGLSCPMPIVKTQKEMKNLEEGRVLEVQATDQGSKADIEAWAKSTGEQYLGTIEQDGVLKHYLRKSDSKKSEQTLTFNEKATLEEVAEKMNDKDVVILDVREQAEYAFNHIPGAISIPFGELGDRYDELDKDAHIYVICRTGNRSDYAAKDLYKKGFKKVKNVVPGMTDWTGPTTSVDAEKQ